MKKFILLKFLFLFVLASNCNFSILAIGDGSDMVPDYTIEAPWPDDAKKSEDVLSADNNLVDNFSNSAKDDVIDGFDRNYFNDDDKTLFFKIKSMMPHVSKKVVLRIVKTILVVGVAGLSYYFGYKAGKKVAADKIKNIVNAVSKDAAAI